MPMHPVHPETWFRIPETKFCFKMKLLKFISGKLFVIISMHIDIIHQKNNSANPQTDIL